MNSGFDDYARDIEAAMYRDMDSIIKAWLGKQAGFYDLMLNDLVEAGMFHVHTLLVRDLCDEQRQVLDQ